MKPAVGNDQIERDVILFFDTTLRDGEQSPGATLNTQEKLEIARQLARLGVDIIEAVSYTHLTLPTSDLV